MKIKLLQSDYVDHVDALEGVLLVVPHDHVDGPTELLPLGLVVNLLDGDLVLLAPRHADPKTEDE